MRGSTSAHSCREGVPVGNYVHVVDGRTCTSFSDVVKKIACAFKSLRRCGFPYPKILIVSRHAISHTSLMKKDAGSKSSLADIMYTEWNHRDTTTIADRPPKSRDLIPDYSEF